jgi:WD40 repeat protein
MSSDLVCFSQWVYYVVAMLDGRRVVSGSRDNTLRVWDVDTGECVRELKGHGGVSECWSCQEREGDREMFVVRVDWRLGG